MKKIITSQLLLTLFCSFFLITSCTTDETGDLEPIGGEDSDTNTTTPVETVEYDLIVNADNLATGERTLDIEAVPGSTVIVNLFFESDDSSGSDDKKMRRVYGTEYTYGESDISQYEFDSSYDLKADGSYDIPSADGYQFIETLNFTAPALDQIDQYNFWTTNARGDFRDVSKRNSISGDAYGSVTIKGADVEVETDIADASTQMRAFSTILLDAPRGDGNSETFLSLFNEEKYYINQGEEYAAFWDFGYYYGATQRASLASASNYPSDIVNIEALSGVTSSDLNKFYFIKSTTISVAQFDAITEASELDFITQPTSERVTNLSIDDIVEFVDQYGNKGLIKVTDIYGTDGVTNNINDHIAFDVKVQVNALPVKL